MDTTPRAMMIHHRGTPLFRFPTTTTTTTTPHLPFYTGIDQRAAALRRNGAVIRGSRSDVPNFPVRRDSMRNMQSVMEEITITEDGLAASSETRVASRTESLSSRSRAKTKVHQEVVVGDTESLESFIAREKPPLVNTILVCFISAMVIVFCLYKLFIGK